VGGLAFLQALVELLEFPSQVRIDVRRKRPQVPSRLGTSMRWVKSPRPLFDSDRGWIMWTGVDHRIGRNLHGPQDQRKNEDLPAANGRRQVSQNLA